MSIASTRCYDTYCPLNWRRFAGVERLEAEDIAGAIQYIVTRPRRVALNEILIRPTEQEW